MQSMNTRSLLVLGILLGLIVAGTGFASAQVARTPTEDPVRFQQTNGSTSNDTATSTNETTVSPGAHLSGMVGVQQVELDGEVEHRSFERAFRASASNDTRARLVARNGETLETRLSDLQEAKNGLEAAVENGSIAQGQYRAQVAVLSARIATLERRLNQTVEAGQSIPPADRKQHGVNVTRLGHLQHAAGNLTGPEIAAIARTIAGPNPGVGPGMRGPPEQVGGGSQGPPTNRTGPPENRSDAPVRATETPSTNGTGMGPPAANESTRGAPGSPSGPGGSGPHSNPTGDPPSESGGGPPVERPSNSGS